jgi:hypothetical protein
VGVAPRVDRLAEAWATSTSEDRRDRLAAVYDRIV